HYIKVHAEKKYSCSKCGKKFGAEWLSKHHESTCGTSWHCQCGATYQNREALLTHARRHKHTLPFELKRGDVCRRKQASSQAAQHIIVPVGAQVIIVIQDQKTSSGQKGQDIPVHGANRTTGQWRNIVPKASSIPIVMPVPSVPPLASAMAGASLSSGSTICEGKVHQACQTNVVILLLLSHVGWNGPSSPRVQPCSRSQSRVARQLVRRKFTGVLQRYRVPMSPDCPFHPSRDLYWWPQGPAAGSVGSASPGWKCPMCGRGFFCEDKLTSHWDQEHAPDLPKASTQRLKSFWGATMLAAYKFRDESTSKDAACLYFVVPSPVT
ncbi:hypothetical protein HPB47_006028, partial [Ixodes persulcatus]